MSKRFFQKLVSTEEKHLRTVKPNVQQRTAAEVQNFTFPSEFCNTMLSANVLMSHQISCLRNPANQPTVATGRNYGGDFRQNRSNSFAPVSTTVPDGLYCPITGELFRDPVIAEDGYTYERQAIVEWINRAGNSPFTRQPLRINNLRPNYTIRQLVEEFSSRNLNLNSVVSPHTTSTPFTHDRASDSTRRSSSFLPNRSDASIGCNQESCSTTIDSQLRNSPFPSPLSSSYKRRRVALLLGNDSYQYISKLTCCVRDAQGMSAKLSALGFDCTVIYDATKHRMNNEIEKLAQKIQPNDCVLIFFSGHGGESKGKAYLAPIDAENTGFLEDQCIGVYNIIHKLERSADDLLIIIICDSCRSEEENATFKMAMKDADNKSRSESFSSSDVRFPTNSQIVIFFSCDPGTVAFANKRRNGYSALTEALLHHISTPDIDIRQMFARVTNQVMQNNNERQRPWINCTLGEEFYSLF